MSRTRIRPVAFAVPAAALLLLSACSSTSTPEASEGPASTVVRASGSWGEKPSVEIPTPLLTDTTECSVLIPGNGPTLVAGQTALVDVTAVSGSTGQVLTQSGYADGQRSRLVVGGGATLPGLAKGLSCAQEGSRVAITTSAQDAFGSAGDPVVGVGANETIVFVVDVHKAYLSHADGAVRLAQNGFPAVVLAPGGQPGITVPKTAAPEELRVEVLKEGSGPVVQSGDTVTVHYTGVLWDSNRVFDSSWARQQPVAVAIGTTAGGQQTIPGFSDAILGQKVGSQVVAVLPPELGYGAKSNAMIPANSTLVFVIDILGVDSAS